MCGRYTSDPAFSDLQVIFRVQEVELFRPWAPSFNIAPTYGSGHEQVIIVQSASGARAARLARWWFIPPTWKRELKALPSSFNARAEELQHKAFWKSAFRNRRCLVPATGWREFVRTRQGTQPYHFHRQRQLFAFAGLWSRWHSPDGEVIDSFAIITTAPTAQAAQIHDRMPLVLPEASYDAWLDPALDGTATLRAACRAAQELTLDIYPSDPIANDSRFEGPATLGPAPAEPKGVQLELFADVTDRN